MPSPASKRPAVRREASGIPRVPTTASPAGQALPAAPALLALLAALALLVLPAPSGAGEEPVAFKFSGRTALNIHYDTDDVRGYTDFATYIKATGVDEVNFNARDVRFGMTATAVEGDWTYRGVFEIDFYGSNDANNLLPRLRLGYAELAGKNGFSLRTGQDWIPVAQQNPGTLDFGILAWGGNLWWRVPQVTVRQKSGNVEFLASLMKHRISTQQEIDEKMPWVLGRLAYTGLQGGKGLFALGGGFRMVTVTDTVDPAGATVPAYEVDYTPWLGVGELKLRLSDRVNLVTEWWAGQGVGREFVRYDLDYNNVQDVEMQAWGGFGSLAFQLEPRIQLNAGYGIDDPADADVLGSTTAPFIRNQVLFGNFKYNLTKMYGMGAEIMHFVTEQRDGARLEGERFTTGFWFVF